MTAEGNVLPSPDLLAFLAFDWLDPQATADERETMLAILDTAGRLAAEAFLPHCRQGDVEEPWLDDTGVHILPAFHGALRQYAELGLFGASFPEGLGGLGLSQTITLAMAGIFGAANAAAAAYTMLTAANARLIAAFGSPRQVEVFARPQIDGRWFGTMCLSEPQAGSSLGDIRTRAIADGQDDLGRRYRLVGNKMWISGGDQDASENIVHLVLAKVAGPDGALPEGSKGISLFIVPKVRPDGGRNDVAVAGLNHKLGYRGTSNCLLNFGENGGAVGWLVGSEGQGLSQMFMMMNEARLSVGMGAAALAYRGYRQALRYAGERLQGRAVGASGGPQQPIVAHPDVRRMLLQQKVYSEGALALCLYCARLVDVGDDDAEALLALLTPVAKSWSSEFGVIASDLAIQVHGGYGYTRDFDVEQLWRDNRLNPIHEGTTGIQAIDLLGRKLLRSDGRALSLLRARVGATVAAARDLPEWQELATRLEAYWDRVAATIERLGTRSPDRALDGATLFLRAFGHGIVAWLWLDQALCAGRLAAPRLAGSIASGCRFFFAAELPQAVAWLEIGGADLESCPLAADDAFV